VAQPHESGQAVGTGVVSSPPPAVQRPAKARLEHLDGIRALAALFVLVHHSWLAVFPGFPVNTGPWWLGWMLYGHMAVSVFIVISGFSLTVAPARHAMALPGRARDFLYRRGWRILPTYWAALAFSCLVAGVITPAQTGSTVSAKAIVVHALLLQDVIDSPKPNGVFWSIAVEWQIYFLFPAMLLLCRRFGSWAMASGTAALVVIGYLMATHLHPFERFLNITPQYVALFAFGVLGASLLHRPPPAAVGRLLLPLAGLLALLFVVLCWRLGSTWVVAQFFWTDLIVGAAMAALLGGLALGHGRPIAAALGTRVLAWIGGYSYSIYLIHAPLLWLVWHFGVSRLDLPPLASLAALLAAAVPATLIACRAFYLVFEKPFLTRRSWAAWRDALRSAGRSAQRATVGPRGTATEVRDRLPDEVA
jgi:peptidoglycan/LPS O-acetylase OafA/YrhL